MKCFGLNFSVAGKILKRKTAQKAFLGIFEGEKKTIFPFHVVSIMFRNFGLNKSKALTMQLLPPGPPSFVSVYQNQTPVHTLRANPLQENGRKKGQRMKKNLLVVVQIALSAALRSE